MKIGDVVTYKDLSLGIHANQFGRYDMTIIGKEGPYFIVKYQDGSTGKQWPANLRLVD